MYRLKQKAVDIHGIPVDDLFAESRVGFKHFLKLRDSKFQRPDFGQRRGDQRKLDPVVRPVITGKNRARTVKADDFSAPAFMIGIMDGGAGKEVVDFFAGVSGFPEEVSLLKRPFSVRTGQEVVLELSKILRKEIPRRQHGVTSQVVIAEQKMPGTISVLP